MNRVSSGFKSLECKYLIILPDIATGSGKTMVAGCSMLWSAQIIFLSTERPAFDLSKMLYAASRCPRDSNPQLTYGYFLISVPSLSLSKR